MMHPSVERQSGPPWAAFSNTIPSLLKDIPVIIAGLALLYGLMSLTRYWAGPVNTQPVIHLSPSILPKYALFSVARLAVAYTISLAITLVYGYVAAHNARAERVLIPLLDTLQSIPVLSFLPPVMVSMVALFPATQLGVELGAILLIATGQVWNMTFSVYSSIKNVPREMLEAAQVYRLNWFQRFVQIELPYAAIGLVWNSMMSVAGGWFFLMACEMFVLGNRDFRLPGLGSYLQVAAGAGDTRAIVWGMAAMIAVIVLLDQLVWRPAIAWSDKFKFESVEGAAPQSFVLTILRRSGILAAFYRRTIYPIEERVTQAFAAKTTAARAGSPPPESKFNKWFARAIGEDCLVVLAWLAYRALAAIAQLGEQQLILLARDAALTFLRENAALVLGALWAVPAGVWIGT